MQRTRSPNKRNTTIWLSLLTEDFRNGIRRQRLARRPITIPAPIERHWRLFFFHTSILKDIGPLAAGTSMAVLEMLAEVVGAEEFLGIVAFAEFVHCGQVLEPTVPIWLREIGKFLAAIATRVVRCSGACLAILGA